MKLFRFAKHKDFGTELYFDFLKIKQFILLSIDIDLGEPASALETSFVFCCWPVKTHAIRLAIHLGKMSLYLNLFGFQMKHRDYWYSPESYEQNYNDLNALLND